MIRLVFLGAAAMGCGRIGFDDLTGSRDAGQEDGRSDPDAAASCFGDIAHDFSSGGADDSALDTTYSWTHAMGAGTNRVLYVWTVVDDRDISVTSLTFGSDSLSNIFAQNGTGANQRFELWRLMNPPAESRTVTVVYSALQSYAGRSVSYVGVDQSLPNDPISLDDGLSGNSSSVTIASAAGDLVVSFGENRAMEDAAADIGEIDRGSSGVGAELTAYSAEEAGASAVTVGWTWTTNAMFGHAAFNLRRCR